MIEINRQEQKSVRIGTEQPVNEMAILAKGLLLGLAAAPIFKVIDLFRKTDKYKRVEETLKPLRTRRHLTLIK